MKVGTVVQISSKLPTFADRHGTLVQIIGKQDVYKGEHEDGRKDYLFGYGVRMVGSDTKMIVAAKYLEPLQPPASRGDMDTKTDWALFKVIVGWRPAPEDLV